MKVSISEIKRLGYEDIVDLPVETLTQRIGAQLGAVEDVEDLGAKYKGVVVAKVVSVSDHPNADRLHVCKIDDGGVVENVHRDSDGHVQVVCGAPNVREGLLVAWLPPHVTVPNTYHHEPFVLEARELRGIISNGMLASPKELALGDSHEGILEIDTEAHPGQAFAEVYHLDDHIIDIENKMFTHRPDCFGLLGVARELAGIQRLPFVSPNWYRDEPVFVEAHELKVSIHNDQKELVPRFMAVAMSGITVKQSPMWLQTALLRLGSRPINNVVDITNYLMLVTGQPLHAYDYDKVASGVLGARMAHVDEKLSLLNGKTITLTENDLVITDGSKPIGLAGVMGGSETEVSESTTRIIIEVASFDMYAVRRASMRHGLFTDAVTRFNKGQSPLQNDRVMAKAIDFFKELANGVVASSVAESRKIENDSFTVSTKASFINARLGLDLTSEDMAALLKNVECEVTTNGDELTVKAPFWRTDLEIAEDIVEEIGRLYGFDHLPRVLPMRSVSPTRKNESIDLKYTVRHSLSRSGANEVLTYSFVHEKLFAKAGQNAEDAFKLGNALSPDLQYFRLSLIPSLLDKVHTNIRAGYEEFALFEIGKVHNARLHANDDEGGLPKEPGLIDLVYAATAKSGLEGAAFYKARRLLDALGSDLNLTFDYMPYEAGDEDFPITKPFDPTRSAYVMIKNTDSYIGVIGEFKGDVSRQFKLPKYSAGFTLGFEELMEAAKNVQSRYRVLSRFPATSQDVCFRVDKSLAYRDLSATVHQALEAVSIETSHEVIDIFHSPGSDEKQVTFRIAMTDHEKTMKGDQANNIVKQVTDAVIAKHHATIV